ncbi:MAG TPA: aminotransferase class I/II-fold pyridoxal phosphate-dependent enzyme [Candidatus Acidoferrales bacterium]|nr:aminotransferase class I/II-fold pyridoxal phosphate-dependent enzyme [Candidatus Acidoferrales bacterium]
MTSRREIGSVYLEWAKLHSKARFGLAGSDVLHFPFADLHANPADLSLSPPGGYGYKPLLEKIAAKSGVGVECVVHAQGTSMANHLAMAALLEPGDEVLVEDPTYEALLAVAQYLGAKIRRFPRKFEAGFQVDPREVERAISPRTRLIVITNLHNPSGVRTPDSVLRILGEVARSLGANVLVDEVYLEACFDSPWQSAVHLGPNFIATSSLTKAYGLTALRCGWVLAAAPLAERMWRINDLFGASSPFPTDLLSVLALDQLPRIAARAKKLLDANRPLLKAFLDSRKDLLAIWPDAGTIAFPQLATGHADAFCQFLFEKYETGVVPGRFFEAPEHFRIGVGGQTETVRDGLKRVSEALDEFARRR